jgi:hypothetical protein
MKKYFVLPLLAVLGYSIVLSFFVVTTTFAQVDLYTEEYMQKHDGGDRVEYLQEMGYSDPWFYVPPVNDVSMSSTDNVPAN